MRLGLIMTWVSMYFNMKFQYKPGPPFSRVPGNVVSTHTSPPGPPEGLSGVGRILVHCKTCLQVPDSRVRVWSQQSCLRRDKIQYFGKVLQNSPLTSHKMRLNRAILKMTLPCQ